jgi:ABC-type uncharacterized transport system substrate-binding protein
LPPVAAHKSRPFGPANALFVIALFGPALVRDTPRPVPKPRLVWVGTSSAASDSGYQRFVQALARQPAARRDVQLDYQSVRDQGPQAAQQDLARRKGPPPAVWVTPTADTARAVRAQHAEHKLVFASYLDPIRLGLVTSLRTPGAHATGVLLDDDLHAKRLELLRDAFPAARVVGVLLDRSWAESRDIHAALTAPGQALGWSVRVFFADEPEEVDALFNSAQVDNIHAWYIPATYIAYRAEPAIRQHLARLRQPAIHTSAGEVARGALMAYSQDTAFAYEMLAELATRVAAGEDAGSIPVQRPLRFVLSVRPRDEPLPLRIHPSVIRRANRVF